MHLKAIVIVLPTIFFKPVLDTLMTCIMKCYKVEGNESHYDKVVKALQDIFEVVTNDMMTNCSRFDML